MTLDAEFAQYQDKSVLVPGRPSSLAGQCFMWFDFILHDVYGLPYFYAPGAINIWTTPGWLTHYFDLVPYFPTMPIQKGDFVIYGSGVGSVFGHVDVAAQNGIGSNYLGYDSNWGGNLTVHTVNHNDHYNQYILGVLRFKSNNGGVNNSIPTSTQVGQIYPVLVGRAPTQDELNLAVGLNWYDWLQYLLPGVQTLRDTITNLEYDRDNNLYPFINKVTAALGLPTGSTADECVAAIKKGETAATQLAPGLYKV